GSSDPNELLAWEVDGVVEDSAAEDAGLVPGDEITALDGTPVDDWDSFSEAVGARAPGEQITLTVERGGDTIETTTTLGARDDDPDAAFLGIGPVGVPASVGPVDAVGETFSAF